MGSREAVTKKASFAEIQAGTVPGTKGAFRLMTTNSLAPVTTCIAPAGISRGRSTALNRTADLACWNKNVGLLFPTIFCDSEVPGTPRQIKAPHMGNGPVSADLADTSSSLLSHIKPKLAYSSATNKPVCLCIIWVHLQAPTITSEERVGEQLRSHLCVVKKAPEPVSKGNKLTCHYCRCGFSSYVSYLDHLHSSQCGHKQRSNNKPQSVQSTAMFPPLNLKQLSRVEERTAEERPEAAAEKNSASLFKQGCQHENPRLSETTSELDTSLISSSAFPLDNCQSLPAMGSSKERIDSAAVSLADTSSSVRAGHTNTVSRPNGPSMSKNSSMSRSAVSISSSNSRKRRKLSHISSTDLKLDNGNIQQQVTQGQQQFHQAGIITKPYFQHHIHSQQQQYSRPYQHQLMIRQQAPQQSWQQQQPRFYTPQCSNVYPQPHPLPGYPMYVNPKSSHLPPAATGWPRWNNSVPSRAPNHAYPTRQVLSPQFNQSNYGHTWYQSSNFAPRRLHQHRLPTYSQSLSHRLAQSQGGQQHWENRSSPHQQHQQQQQQKYDMYQQRHPNSINSQDLIVERNFCAPQSFRLKSYAHNEPPIIFDQQKDEINQQRQRHQQRTFTIPQGNSDLGPSPCLSPDRAAASASDSECLPVLANELRTLDCSEELPSSNAELFVSNASNNSCTVIVNELTSEEVMTSLTNITSFNNLVTYLGEVTFEDVEKEHKEQQLHQNCAATEAQSSKTDDDDARSPHASSPFSLDNSVRVSASSAASIELSKSEMNLDNRSRLQSESSSPKECVQSTSQIPASYHYSNNSRNLQPLAVLLEVGSEKAITQYNSLESTDSSSNLLSGEKKNASLPCTVSFPAPSGSKKSSDHHDGDLFQCPHRAVIDLPKISVAEQAKDQLRLVTMQAQLGYVLLGLLGEKRLITFGYPHRSVISILHAILALTETNLIEEHYNCTQDCKNINQPLDKEQLSYRLVQRKIRVLRANIGKLFCICVPVRNKWKEFGWEGKSVEQILEELSKAEIPTCHLGDPDYKDLNPEADEEECEDLAENLEAFQKIDDMNQIRATNGATAENTGAVGRIMTVLSSGDIEIDSNNDSEKINVDSIKLKDGDTRIEFITNMDGVLLNEHAAVDSVESLDLKLEDSC